MKTVFFDSDTQIDFLYPAGALYVPGAERIIPAVSRLNHFAAAQGMPLISTVDAHAEDDPEFRFWPPHCVAESVGQRKPDATLVDGYAVISSGAEDWPPAPQFVLEKQTTDVFDTAVIGKLIDRLGADAYVVYGVVTEVCVRSAALGLLRTGKPVTLVTDAVAALREEDAERFFEEFRAKGGRFCASGTLLGATAAG